MNISTARKAVLNPDAYETRELHEALDMLVNDERFTEGQVTRGQERIEAVLKARKEKGGRTYPAGTDIRDMSMFDRSTKVEFQCAEHSEIKYRSKDPFVSNWFPANEITEQCEWSPRLMAEHCTCTLRKGTWVTSTEYTNYETQF